MTINVLFLLKMSINVLFLLKMSINVLFLLKMSIDVLFLLKMSINVLFLLKMSISVLFLLKMTDLLFVVSPVWNDDVRRLQVDADVGVLVLLYCVFQPRRRLFFNVFELRHGSSRQPVKIIQGNIKCPLWFNLTLVQSN